MFLRYLFDRVASEDRSPVLMYLALPLSPSLHGSPWPRHTDWASSMYPRLNRQLHVFSTVTGERRALVATLLVRPGGRLRGATQPSRLWARRAPDGHRLARMLGAQLLGPLDFLRP